MAARKGDSAKVVKRCCKTCALWDIEAFAGKPVRCDRLARCRWTTILPFSVFAQSRPIPGFTLGDHGATCPIWRERNAQTPLPCPCCGSTDIDVRPGDMGVKCLQCGVFMPSIRSSDPKRCQNALEAWNRRTVCDLRR